MIKTMTTLAVVVLCVSATTAAFAGSYQHEEKARNGVKVPKDYKTIMNEVKQEWGTDKPNLYSNEQGKWKIRSYLRIESLFNINSYYDRQLKEIAREFNEVAGTEVIEICRECSAHIVAKFGGVDCHETNAGYVNFYRGELVMCRPEQDKGIMLHEITHATGFPHSTNPGLMSIPRVGLKFTDQEKRLIRQTYKEMK